MSEALPVNAQTRRPYRGINFTLLSLQAGAQGYASNRWATYRQALEMGGQVRKGQTGATIVFWQLRKVAATAEAFPDTNPVELPSKVFPLLRAYTVFNVDQIDGVDIQRGSAKPSAWPAEARAEELLLMSGATLRFGGAKAYYRPDTDEIQLPPRTAFPTASGYYNVALHELTHWSGHPNRCARDFSGRFRNSAYAAEELVAEIGRRTCVRSAGSMANCVTQLHRIGSRSCARTSGQFSPPPPRLSRRPITSCTSPTQPGL